MKEHLDKIKFFTKRIRDIAHLCEEDNKSQLYRYTEILEQALDEAYGEDITREYNEAEVEKFKKERINEKHK